jgi:hypothetical protein
MSGASSQIFFALFGVGFSALFSVMTYIIRLFPSSALNVPNAEYWRSPEHFGEACEFLFASSFWLGSLALLWAGAMNYLVVVANRSAPPLLSSFWVWTLCGLFLAGTMAWVVGILRFFGRTPVEKSISR